MFLLLVYLFAEEGEAAFPLYVLLPVAAINEVDVAAVRRGQIAVVLSVVHLVLRCEPYDVATGCAVAYGLHHTLDEELPLAVVDHCRSVGSRCVELDVGGSGILAVGDRTAVDDGCPDGGLVASMIHRSFRHL